VRLQEGGRAENVAHVELYSPYHMCGPYRTLRTVSAGQQLYNRNQRREKAARGPYRQAARANFYHELMLRIKECQRTLGEANADSDLPQR
jgi:hypothetical protein